MTPPPAHVADDLREDIEINEAIYRSLENTTIPSAIARREQIARKLKDLRASLSALVGDMQQSQPLPFWGYSDDTYTTAYQDPQTGSSVHSGYSHYSPSSANESTIAPLATLDLPNRKRERAESHVDLPQSKARRPAAESYSTGFVDTSADFDLDDDYLSSVFGEPWEGGQKSKQYMKELEARKRQEEEDRAFAMALQEKWNKEHGTDITPGPAYNAPTNHTQSFAPPNEPWQQPAQTTFPRIKIETNHFSNPISATSTPQTDSSSGLEEISALDWNNRYGAARYPQNNVLPTPGLSSYGSLMPGTFPTGTHNPYASTAGSSVYDNNSFAASGSSINWDTGHEHTGYLRDALVLLGSANMPVDLDTYQVPSYTSGYSPYADTAQNHEALKDLLKHIRPDEELTEEQLREVQPQGLAINLMPHQRKGFAWMKSMEEGTNKGGILGDDMGLGKTVQAISIILARPPEPGKRRPTLVVAPVALMQQWDREFKKFVKKSHALKVLVLHQENRNRPWSYIQDYDVVLTTYGTLTSELKRSVEWKKFLAVNPDALPSAQQQLPLLGDRSYFHRIILDEAQNIKNRNTKSAVAACHLKADHRWCLSGTPMQNNVDEIYSLIKFCRIKPYHEWERFSRDIGRPLKRSSDLGKEKAMKQLQAILKAICLRRTKKSKIDGQPIIQLPEKRTIEDRAIFSKDEKEFYKQLESQAQIQFNRYLKNGTVGRHYSHALVLLLRLRQCCCSPQLVTNAKDFMTSGTLEEQDRVANARGLPEDAVRRLDENDAYECPICMDAVVNPIIFNPCGHTLCNECLAAMVDKAMTDNNAAANLTCPHCRGNVDTNKITDYESYLRVFHPDREGVRPLDEGEDGIEEDDSDSSGSDSVNASDEDDDGDDLRDFIVPDDDDIEYDSDADEKVKKTILKNEDIEQTDSKGKAPAHKEKKRRSTKKHKGKGKAKDRFASLAQLRREGLKNKAAKKRYLKKLAKGFETSAKIEKTLEILHEIRDRGEGEKTIVFSSFTSFLDLLEVPLSQDDALANYVRYDGSMKAQDRNESVIKFTDDRHCKVMLVSLKAGNAGLNLTAANHVILLDPFWNPFVEYQAADRCYRIGQLREVTIHRVLIGEDEIGSTSPEQDFTVEDRILRLQEKKKQLVETALDEKAATSLGRLTTRDLGYLFGVNSMD